MGREYHIGDSTHTATLSRLMIITPAMIGEIIDGEIAAEAIKEPHVDIGGPIDVATITGAGVRITRHASRKW